MCLRLQLDLLHFDVVPLVQQEFIELTLVNFNERFLFSLHPLLGLVNCSYDL